MFSSPVIISDSIWTGVVLVPFAALRKPSSRRLVFVTRHNVAHADWARPVPVKTLVGNRYEATKCPQSTLLFRTDGVDTSRQPHNGNYRYQ